MDPADFRIKNAAKEGVRRVDGPVYARVGMVETVEAIKELICDEPMRRKQGAESRSRIAKAYSSEAVRPILHSEWVLLLGLDGANASKLAQTHSDISGAASIVTEPRP